MRNARGATVALLMIAVLFTTTASLTFGIAPKSEVSANYDPLEKEGDVYALYGIEFIPSASAAIVDSWNTGISHSVELHAPDAAGHIQKYYLDVQNAALNGRDLEDWVLDHEDSWVEQPIEQRLIVLSGLPGIETVRQLGETYFVANYFLKDNKIFTLQGVSNNLSGSSAQSSLSFPASLGWSPEANTISVPTEALHNVSSSPQSVPDLSGPSETTGKPTLQFPFCGGYSITRNYASLPGGHPDSNTSRYAIDFDLFEGTPVYAAHSGTIVTAQDIGAGGKAIYIQYDQDPAYRTAYMHLKSFNVTSGRVNAGSLIGYSGKTGYWIDQNGKKRSLDPHLHFVLWKDGFNSVLPEPLGGKTKLSPKEFHIRVCDTSSSPTILGARATIPGRTSSDVTVRVRRQEASGPNQRFDGDLVLTRKVKLVNGVVKNINLGTLPGRTYEITIKTDHSLANGEEVAIRGRVANGPVNFGSLLGGDYAGVNPGAPQSLPQDDIINIIDFNVFAKNYSPNVAPDWMNIAGGPGLNIVDLQYLATTSYNKKGAEYKYIKKLNASSTAMQAAEVAALPRSNQNSNSSIALQSATLDIDPTFSTYSVGTPFTVTVHLQQDGSSIDGANLLLHYDSCSLEVVEFPATDLVFPMVWTPVIDVDRGTIEFSASKNLNTPAITASGQAAKIKFRPVYGGGTGSLMTLEVENGMTTETNVVDSQTGADILGGGSFASIYTLVGAPARGSVSGVLSPSSNAYSNIWHLPISIDVDDGCGRNLAEKVKFEAYYDGAWHWLTMDEFDLDDWGYVWDTSAISDQIIKLRATIYGWDTSANVFVSDNIVLDRTPPTITSFGGPLEMSSSGTGRLSWSATDAFSGIKSHSVQQRIGTEGEWTEIAGNYSGTTYELSALNPGTDYYYRVISQDHAGNESIVSETLAISGRYEPDNIAAQANIIAPDETQFHSLFTTGDTDWVKFTLTQESAISIETDGNEGDTQLRLYNSAVNEIADDDDGGNGAFSRIDLQCGVDALPPGTYYASVNEKGNNDELWSYSLKYSVIQTCPQQPTATATPLPSPTATATPTLGPSLTATATATPGPSLTATATATPGPSLTPTATSTVIPNLTATATATLIHNLTPTATATQVVSPTPPTATPTATRPPNLDWQTYLPIAIGGDVGRR